MRANHTLRTFRILVIATVLGFVLQTNSILLADVIYTSRFSEIELQSGNMGDLTALSSTSDPAVIFNDRTDGSHTQEVAGGGINTGSWDVNQFSFGNDDMIVAQGLSATQIGGTGIGTLIGLNTFEMQFESVGETPFVFSGTHFGTDTPGANDAVEIFLEHFDGVTFQTMFSNVAGDNLNEGSFSGTFQDGELYRMRAFTRAFVQGNDTNQAGYDLQLSFSSIPEPSSTTLVTLAGMGFLGIARRRKR